MPTQVRADGGGSRWRVCVQPWEPALRARQEGRPLPVSGARLPGAAGLRGRGWVRRAQVGTSALNYRAGTALETSPVTGGRERHRQAGLLPLPAPCCPALGLRAPPPCHSDIGAAGTRTFLPTGQTEGSEAGLPLNVNGSSVLSPSERRQPRRLRPPLPRPPAPRLPRSLPGGHGPPCAGCCPLATWPALRKRPSGGAHARPCSRGRQPWREARSQRRGFSCCLAADPPQEDNGAAGGGAARTHAWLRSSTHHIRSGSGSRRLGS